VEWAFYPQHLAVRANEPVRFVVKNEGEERHRYVIAGHGETWRSSDPQRGETTTLDATFATPGVYQVWCSVGSGSHKDAGMVGAITVVGTGEDPVLTSRVTVGEFRIQPAAVTTVAGQTTRFDLRNTGEMNHNFVVAGHGGEWRSPSIQPGTPTTWDVTLERAGTYEVYCSFTRPESHKDLGMVGTIEVLRGS
jgi:plastocyanin